MGSNLGTWRALMGLDIARMAELHKTLGGDGVLPGDSQTVRASHIWKQYGAAKIGAAMLGMVTTPTPGRVDVPVCGADNAELAGKIAEIIASHGGRGINEQRVREIVDEAVGRVTTPRRVEVKVEDRAPVDLGVQHERFDALLKAASARTVDGHRLNIWLAGPAGTGKTTAARMVAKALGVPFYTNGAIQTPYELTGFVDAGGTYRTTEFRKAYGTASVYLFDEVDSSAERAVVPFNGALANGHFAFPDGTVERHPDCIIIAGANTMGNGATSEYVGRNRQDAAFLDRFVTMDWPIDEKLEKSITGNDDWVARVQSVRASCKARGVKGHMVTPRASVYGDALLRAGLDRETVEAMTLRKGLNNETWAQVTR